MKEEEETSEYHTCREVEEGTGRLECRSKYTICELTERGLEGEEVNAVDVVQEIVGSLSIRELPRA